MDQTATAHDAAATEAAADEARLPLPPGRGIGRSIPDDASARSLEPASSSLAVRRSALLYRPETPEVGARRRLSRWTCTDVAPRCCAGRIRMRSTLTAVTRRFGSNERLLLVLCDGQWGSSLRCTGPRLLRGSRSPRPAPPPALSGPKLCPRSRYRRAASARFRTPCLWRIRCSRAASRPLPWRDRHAIAISPVRSAIGEMAEHLPPTRSLRVASSGSSPPPGHAGLFHEPADEVRGGRWSMPGSPS